MIRREITTREAQGAVQEVFTHYVVRPREYLAGTFRLIPLRGMRFLAGFRKEGSKEWLAHEVDAWPVEIETKSRRGVMWGWDTYLGGIEKLFEPFVAAIDMEFPVSQQESLTSEVHASLPTCPAPTLEP